VRAKGAVAIDAAMRAALSWAGDWYPGFGLTNLMYREAGSPPRHRERRTGCSPTSSVSDPYPKALHHAWVHESPGGILRTCFGQSGRSRWSSGVEMVRVLPGVDASDDVDPRLRKGLLGGPTDQERWLVWWRKKEDADHPRAGHHAEAERWPMPQQFLTGALIVAGAVILLWLLSAVIAVVLIYRRGHDSDAD
jgi:hypothetical protein